MVKIDIGNGYPFEIEKEEYKKVKNDHPEFFNEEMESPYKIFRNNNKSDYRSLAQEDIYMTFYAHFLQLRYTDSKHIAARKRAVRNYLIINDIGKGLAQGGTYYSHEVPRIPAYVEYNIWRILNRKVEVVSKNEFEYRKMKIVSMIKNQIENRKPLGWDTEGVTEWTSNYLFKINKELEESITSVIDLKLVEMYITID